jgi:hypothetical protein
MIIIELTDEQIGKRIGLKMDDAAISMAAYTKALIKNNLIIFDVGEQDASILVIECKEKSTELWGYSVDLEENEKRDWYNC